MIIDQWTQAANRAALFEGMSRADIEGMSVAEYSRLTGRPAPAESAVAGLDRAYGPSVPQVPQQPHAPAQEPQQPPLGLDPNSDAYFLMWRQNRARGGEGVGVFGGVGSRSAEYADGVRRHAGRTGWNQSNVVESPRIEGRFVNHDALRDNRTAAQRFSTPGNAFNL